MLPIQIPLVIAGGLILPKLNLGTLVKKGRRLFTLNKKRSKPVKRYTLANPLQTLAKGLTNAVNQLGKSLPLGKRAQPENYSTVLNGFIPSGAAVLKPEYPRNSGEYLLADLDGDGRNELVSTYRLNNDLKTIVLKKQEGKWQKVTEISHTDYDTLNYREAADFSGTGKKHLLVGAAAKNKTAAVSGYSLEGGTAARQFTHNYNRFEVVKPRGRRSGSKAYLAVWNRKDSDSYNIDVYSWNGTQLEPRKNISGYYMRSVMPFYVDKINKEPLKPSGWYNLADTLAKAGHANDALMAAEAGIRLDKDGTYKDKFQALENTILGKK